MALSGESTLQVLPGKHWRAPMKGITDWLPQTPVLPCHAAPGRAVPSPTLPDRALPHQAGPGGVSRRQRRLLCFDHLGAFDSEPAEARGPASAESAQLPREPERLTHLGAGDDDSIPGQRDGARPAERGGHPVPDVSRLGGRVPDRSCGDIDRLRRIGGDRLRRMHAPSERFQARKSCIVNLQR